MKRFLTALLAGCVLISLTVSTLAAGPEKITEYDERFTDVPSGNWAEPYIAAVYEYGLMNGTSPTTFSHGGSMSVAAASILAKVARDRYCLEMDRLYPAYQFAKHKGYPTAEHMEIVRKLGPCPLHRKTFLKFLDK